MKIQGKKVWIMAAAIAVLMMVAFYAMPRGRMLVWRMIDRPDDYVKTVVIPAERGKIYDSKDNVLATNKIVYDLHMDCCAVEDPNAWREKSRRLAQELSVALPHRTAPQWWDYLQGARQNRRRFIPIVKNVDYSVIDSLNGLTLLNEGTYKGGKIVTEKVVREYPYGTLARRTIGVWREGLQDYLFGLEGQFDGDLNGEAGYRELKVGQRRGRRRQWEISRKDETDGWDIHTTLDIKKQAVADSVLLAAVESDNDIAGGCLALMEVGTGKVVALANIHRLDNGMTGEYYNYMLSHSYEPGEVAQTMTLAAALSDGIINSLDEKLPINHARFTGTDSISVAEGFAKSSRDVTSALAMKYAEFPDYYYQWYDTFCIGSSNFDISGMRELDMVNPIARDANTLVSMGSGFEFTVCPMHMLAFYNTVANGGVLMEPMLVNRMESDRYGAQYMKPVVLNDKVFREDVADSLKKALTLCVEEGTAKALQGMPQRIAGKTGTSRQIIDPDLRGGSMDPYCDSEGRMQYAGTFAGFYPAESPRYSVICVLFTKPTHTPLYGGLLPAETVKRFVEGM